MTDPKLIEAVARAIWKSGFEAGRRIAPPFPGDNLPAVSYSNQHFDRDRALEQARQSIAAYEAARGDGVWVPRAEYLILTAETRHREHVGRLMSLEGIRESLRRNAKAGRAMIAAAKGE